jgi:hypothetical protein
MRSKEEGAVVRSAKNRYECSAEPVCRVLVKGKGVVMSHLHILPSRLSVPSPVLC